jgi:RNA polymerase sigma-70 factor (ECF subfamily)
MTTCPTISLSCPTQLASNEAASGFIAHEAPRPELITVDLLSRIGRGDETAMVELYDRTSGVIFRLACRLLRDAGAAEEVVHDVYMHVWRKAAEFNPARGTPTSWLLLIARSRTLDRLRSRRAYRYEQTLGDVPSTAFSIESKLEQSLMCQQSAQYLQYALSQLPEQQRQLIEMGFFQGLSHQEIAEKTGEPLGTVKTRIRSGITRLRDLLTSSGMSKRSFALSSALASR